LRETILAVVLEAPDVTEWIGQAGTTPEAIIRIGGGVTERILGALQQSSLGARAIVGQDGGIAPRRGDLRHQAWRLSTKPFEPDDFRHTILHAHQQHQMLVENRRLRALAEDRAERLAAWNERLEEQVLEQANVRLQGSIDVLAQRETELARLSAQLLQVQEQERRQLSLDLHDDPLQRAVLLQRAMKSAPSTTGSVRWQQQLEEIVVSLKAICQGLRPPTLDDFGLTVGLDWLLADVGARSDLSTTLQIRTAASGSFQRLDPSLEIALYRVAQEVLNDVLDDGTASRCDVTLEQTGVTVALHLAYDAPTATPAPPNIGLNLLRMRERLALWNGAVWHDSPSSGGTVTHAVVQTSSPSHGKRARYSSKRSLDTTGAPWWSAMPMTHRSPSVLAGAWTTS
jgi:signal transduction histidine kinase